MRFRIVGLLLIPLLASFLLAPFTAEAALATLIARRNRRDESETSQVLSLTAGQSLYLEVDSSAYTDPAESINVQTEVSLDGGQTWMLDSVSTTHGAVARVTKGPPNPTMWLFYGPPVSVRVTMTVVGQIVAGLQYEIR